MSSVASEPPFPLPARRNEWFLPVMLAPSLYMMVSFAVCLATGSSTPCSPTLLLLVGALSVLYGGWVILRDTGPAHRRICAFCAVLFLVYIQLLLPQLWGWPGLD